MLGMFGRLIGVKLFINVSKTFPFYAAKQYSSTTSILMIKKFKKLNLPSVPSKVKKMGITSSAFKVEEKSPVFYKGAKILDNNDNGDETFRLYQLEQSDAYEAVLYNHNESPVCFSVFRLEDEQKAKETFRQLCQQLSPFYQSCSRVYDTPILQRLLNSLEEHPDMELAVVARQVGLTECLKHEKIAATVKAPETTGGGASSDSSLLQAAKFGFMEKFDTSLTSASSTSLTKDDEKGNTAVHYAVGQPELLDKILLKATQLGSQVVNTVNNSDETPLHVACMLNQTKGVQVLVDRGANLRVPSGYTFPIHCSAKYNSIDCLKLICEIDKESTDLRDKKYGGTPLHWSKSKEATELLIEAGADVEAGNSEGETPLHIMTKRKRLDCLVSLLSHEADVNALGMQNETPLHMAVQVGDVGIVKALIVFGGDLNAVNSKNQTPRHVATVSKARFRNEIIHALCLVGAAPCNPRKCNYQCNKPFSADQYPVGNIEKGNELSTKMIKERFVAKIDDISRIMAAGTHANVKYSKVQAGKNENEGASIVKKKRKEDTALCLDGGGIRGLILIQVLLNLERVAKQPLVKLFDWIAGTSTGGILALGLIHGKTVPYMQQLYFRFKDQVFVGSRPYPSEPFEKFLIQEFGEKTTMTSVPYPRVLATGALADRIPPALHLFRNFNIPQDDVESNDSSFPAMTKPQHQLVWRAARGTGAAPTYFRAMGRMLDGGLIANNPTLDLISVMHSFYKNAEPKLSPHDTCKKIGLVFSVGTGKPPEAIVKNIDVLRPSCISDVAKAAFGVQALVEMMVEQATSSTGAVVDRAQAWCEMIEVCYRRLNPHIYSDVHLDEKNDLVLVNMLWETQAYIFEQRHTIQELAKLLT